MGRFIKKQQVFISDKVHKILSDIARESECTISDIVRAELARGIKKNNIQTAQKRIREYKQEARLQLYITEEMFQYMKKLRESHKGLLLKHILQSTIDSIVYNYKRRRNNGL